MTEEGAGRAVAVLLVVARTLVMLWVVLWLFMSLLGAMASDGCVGDNADACGPIGVAWTALMVAQVANLVLTGVFSDTERPRRTRVIAMAAGGLAAPVAFIAFGAFVDARLGI